MFTPYLSSLLRPFDQGLAAERPGHRGMPLPDPSVEEPGGPDAKPRGVPDPVGPASPDREGPRPSRGNDDPVREPSTPEVGPNGPKDVPKGLP
jgi:hypothetical protein